MNTRDDELGRRLTSELNRRTDGMHDTPLQLDDVLGKATSIRRRRRVASGLGVAAAIAVIVPTAMFATKGTDSRGVIPATSSPTTASSPSVPTPSPTPSTTPVTDPKPHALDVRDLPTGAPPAVAYRVDSDLHGFATTAGGSTVEWRSDGVTVTTPDGQQLGPWASSSPLARNAAGTIVAWLTDDGTVMAWQDGQSQPLTLGRTTLGNGQLEALTGDDCTGPSCEAWVRGTVGLSGLLQSEGLDWQGATRNPDHDDRIRAVRDASADGLVLGSTEITDSSSCSAVIDAADPAQPELLKTCDYQLDSFSPDGSLVLASEAYHDGDSSGTIAVFATAGDRLAYRIRTGQHLAGYHQAVWEDDRHILFTAVQDDEWSVVRMDAVTGAMEYAVAPQPGDPYQSPFVLETR